MPALVVSAKENQGADFGIAGRNARAGKRRENTAMKCERCGWAVPEGERRCANCRGIYIFQMAARVIGRAIAAEPNMLARLVLLKRFFGVAVNTWEQMRLFGDAPSVGNPSQLPR